MGRGVRELAAMLPDEHRAGDLIEAARKLCGAFGNFLDKVHPEKQEKRANILSAASRVGELSHDVINTINDQSQEDHLFHDQLNQRARNVATSTAKLVLQYVYKKIFLIILNSELKPYLRIVKNPRLKTK